MDHSEIFKTPAFIWWFLILGGMSIVFIIAFCPDLISYIPCMDHVNDIGLLIFQSQTGLKILFVFACLIHLAEAVYAARIALFLGFKDTWVYWFAQTALLGYPSLRHLLIAQRERQKMPTKKLK
mmetsp:Transcript_5244/g.5375  ORF Transcript_5244/g.5375 Transcript_5244/m.5375 type:complete len:124 (+) Transcript_5244:81-452(+)